jgi:hypothetical protein
MALQFQPEVIEADITEEDGVFFQSRGAVCFTPESELSSGAYKSAGQVLAVSRRHGIIILSDPRGAVSVNPACPMYACMHACVADARTSEVLGWLQEFVQHARMRC